MATPPLPSPNSPNHQHHISHCPTPIRHHTLSSPSLTSPMTFMSKGVSLGCRRTCISSSFYSTMLSKIHINAMRPTQTNCIPTSHQHVPSTSSTGLQSSTPCNRSGIHSFRYHDTACAVKNGDVQYTMTASNEYQVYSQAMNCILAGKKFQTIHKSLDSQGIWSKDVFHSFNCWLLMKEPLVDQSVTRNRWYNLQEDWLFGAIEAMDMTRSAFASELRLQRETFKSTILANSNNLSTLHAFPPSFFPMAQLVFQEMIKQCTHNSQPAASRVVWEKIKESGMLMNQVTISTLLKTLQSVDISEKYAQEIAMYSDCLYEPTKTSLILRIEGLLKEGKTDLAEEVAEHSNVSSRGMNCS